MQEGTEQKNEFDGTEQSVDHLRRMERIMLARIEESIMNGNPDSVQDKAMYAKLKHIREDIRSMTGTQKTGPRPVPVAAVEETSVLEIKNPETKTFSTDFLEEAIKEIILSLLQENELTKGVEGLDVKANGNEISLNIKIEREMDKSVPIQANLKNWGGGIVVLTDYEIDTMWPLRERLEKVIVPILEKVSQKLKNYIEGQESKKIKEMKIENGELGVTFELPKEEKELELEVKRAAAGAPPDETPDPVVLRKQAERERIERLREDARGMLEEAEANRARKLAAGVASAKAPEAATENKIDTVPVAAVEAWTAEEEARRVEIRRILAERGEK